MYSSKKILSIALSTLLFIAVLPACAVEKENLRQYNNPTGDEFPLIAYHAFNDSSQITSANYKSLKDAGFNMALSNIYDDRQIYKMLELCDKQGLKLIVNRWGYTSSKYIGNETRKFMEYPALGGILIWDEPNSSKFLEIKALKDAVLKTDANTLVYINLLPNYANPSQLGASSYQEYLETFVKEVKPQFLSYDNYGIIKSSSTGEIKLRDNYFENLEIAYKVAKGANIPLWTFCLSTPHGPYPVPSEAQLTFSAFSGLAYGSQCIQYYGYAAFQSAMPDYARAPLNIKGKKNKIWTHIRNVNTQIQALSDVFLGAEIKNVWHTGEYIPKGTKKLSAGWLPDPFTSILSDGTGVIVSEFNNKDNNYLLIVNRDFKKKQTLRITKKSGVTRILPNGKRIIDESSKVVLPAGGYCLYTW